MEPYITDLLKRRLEKYLNNQEIELMYLVGSRLWGTMISHRSDYDVIIIVSGSLEKVVTTLAGDIKLDVVVMGRCEYKEQLAQQEMLYLVCASIPEGHGCLLYKNESSSLEPFRLNSQLLWASVTKKVEKDMLKSGKFFCKGSESGGRKVLCHAIRTLLFTNQLIEHGSVTDFEEGCDVFQQVLAHNGPTTHTECLAFLQPLQAAATQAILMHVNPSVHSSKLKS